MGAAQILSVTEIAPKSRFLCVNRSPIRYGFRAGAEANQHSVTLALVYFVLLLLVKGTQYWLIIKLS